MLMISVCLSALGASGLIVLQYFRCVTSPGLTVKVKPGKIDNRKEGEGNIRLSSLSNNSLMFRLTTRWNVSGPYQFTVYTFIT